jgi:preprotein translocase subunit Sec63
LANYRKLSQSKQEMLTRYSTVQYHPDKLQNPSPEQLVRAEAFYVHLKNARDTLAEPARRFAYERFGPDMLEWKHCLTKLDFLMVGVKQVVPYYLISVFTLVAMGVFRYSEYGRYVRILQLHKRQCQFTEY